MSARSDPADDAKDSGAISLEVLEGVKIACGFKIFANDAGSFQEMEFSPKGQLEVWRLLPG
jgi:hypothetical protein